MSKTLEKLREIKSLPIFPLPMVLMPNELMPLHIFEERYRTMLSDVAGSNNFFGINMFEPEDQFVTRPEIGSVGCIAEIRDRQTMDDGRSNIITLGGARYRLVDYLDTPSPYLVAEVEFFEDDPEDPAVVDPLADEVFTIFERIAKAAFEMSGSRGRFPEITRTDPESFSFLTAAAFNFENDHKYRLIEMTSTTVRLEELKRILSAAVVRMEENAGIKKAAQTNGHSHKKLDI